MPFQVVDGAMISCSMALVPAPVPLNCAVPPTLVTAGGMPAATVMHFAPMVNIPTFGMCNSPTNPQVIAATAAALGVHTPMPCIPATIAPWEPPSESVMLAGMPALTNSATCMCMWEGEITIVEAGQVQVQVT
ncbi:MAG TPA: DUF4280 domain-containing protein [Acidimicrobiales bacterium]|nr:DUF4280 domain-containing protein [Acidimicrobiales bacterium]